MNLDQFGAHITLGGVFEVLDEALRHRDVQLKESIETIWTRDLADLFRPRFVEKRSARRNRTDHNVQHPAVNDQGRTTMDGIILDPETKIAWLDRHEDTRSPSLLKAGTPLSLTETTYFEIEIVDFGEEGLIGIGLVPRDYPPGNQPGWRSGSIGYHADDGGIFIGYGQKTKTKETCNTGDRMGCGIEMIGEEQFVYFTKNGNTVAEQPFNCGDDLFPAVGLNSPGVRVRLLDGHVWGLAPGNAPYQDLTETLNYQPDDGLDITVTEQTGHISVFWKDRGFRDVMVPATVPFSRDKAYFEIELFAIGENDDISIGCVPKNYPRTQHPGWLPNSIGFHVAKGQFFTGQPYTGVEQLEKFVVGDKIGCGVEYRGNTIQVYFNRNGVGFLEQEIALHDAVYPAVGLRSAGKTVSVCVQDFETWGFEVKEFTRNRTCQKTSAIKCDFDSCTASLPSVSGQTMIATLIANEPFSKDLSHFQFEFLKGESVVVGVVSQDYDLEELPGCHPNSLGYHSDDGGIYEESGITNLFYDVCSHGDTMGCSVEFDSEQPLFCFTRNGQTVVEFPFGDHHQKWFPAIGMRSEQTSASVLISDMNVNIWRDLPSRAPFDGTSHGATGGAANVPVSRLEAFEEELKCPICWNILNKPKMFPCRQQHSFCLECLRGLFAAVAPGNVVNCPICRSGAPAPQCVRDLPDNAILSRLVEAYKQLKE